MEKQIEKIKKKLVKFLKENGVVKAGIFGSYARGEQKRNSDIDILVKVKKEFSLLDLIKLELTLRKILGKKVDLVEYEGLNPLIRNQILREEVRII